MLHSCIKQKNMNLELQKEIVFFDIESTGLNIMRDRIVQIALIKMFPGDKEPEEAELLVNPGIPISKEAMEVHGITAEMVRNKPDFKSIAKRLFDWIGDADLGGYNSNRFDIPMLMEEFARAGLDFDISKRRLVDVQRIFYRMEPRTLKAAYKKFCGKDLVDAHDALVDVKATVEVLKGQLDAYKEVDYEDGDGFIVEKPIQNNIQKLHDFTNDLNTVDVTNRLKYNADGDIVFNFGKYANQTVAKVLKENKQYHHWIQEKDFSQQVKKIIKAEYDKIYKK